jgi:tRNA nucleotidyltransferase/poly(A) polymerase
MRTHREAEPRPFQAFGNRQACSPLFITSASNVIAPYRHYAATIKFREFDIDVVNLRSESYTESSRIPAMQLGTPTEDALRRDLTINALYYNIHTQQVEDYTGKGLMDLRNKIARTPLPSLVTLTDDPLRAFRIVRFAARFGFAIDSEAVQACRDPQVHANLHTKVSRERLRIELMKMLEAPSAERAIVLLHSFGLLQGLVVLPQVIYHAVRKPLSSTTGDSRGWLHTHDFSPYPHSAPFREQFLPRGVCTAQLVKYFNTLQQQPDSANKWPLVGPWLHAALADEQSPVHLW